MAYISQVAIPLEPAVKEIAFIRMPDRHLSDPTFLRQFVGIYDLPATQLTIALKNGITLTATFQGGQDFVLVPYQGTEFSV